MTQSQKPNVPGKGTLALDGAREGDVLIGLMKQTRGIKLQALKDIPPGNDGRIRAPIKLLDAGSAKHSPELEAYVGHEFLSGDDLHNAVCRRVGKKVLHFLNGHAYRVESPTNKSASGDGFDETRRSTVSLALSDHAAMSTKGPESTIDADPEFMRDLAEILESTKSDTVREQLVNARVGQGEFRHQVLARWNFRCCVTESTTVSVIRASHIKPWRDSSETERLDSCNGLPLVATLDALFDAGLISFGDDGNMLVSARLSDSERSVLGLANKRLASTAQRETKEYLRYHREHIFRDPS